MTDPWATPPAPGHADPWVPPPGGGRTNRALLVAGVVAAVLAAVVAVALGRAVVSAIRDGESELREREERRNATSAATEAILSGPPDTETVSPAPDGSRLFRSRAAEPDAHAYRVRLPGPWDGWFVGTRQHEDVYVDAVFTRTGAVGMSVEVLRIDTGVRFDPHQFGEALTESIETDEPPGTIVAPFAERRVADDEEGYAVDAVYTAEDGTPMRLRVVTFQHGGEEFRLDLDCPVDLWDTVEPEFERILRSWRWG